MMAVARTSVTVFNKNGCMRKGLYDLKLFFNDDCEQLYAVKSSKSNAAPSFLTASQQDPGEITQRDLNFSKRKHTNTKLIVPEEKFQLKKNKKFSEGVKKNQMISVDPSRFYFTSMAQYLHSDLSLYPIGTHGISERVNALNKASNVRYLKFILFFLFNLASKTSC